MSTIPQVSQAMHDLLLTAAEAADDKLHFSKRPDRAKFTASTLTQTLVLGFLAHPDARIEQLTHTAARLGVDVSPQAIDQRFSFDTAALLREVLASSMQHLIAAERVAIPILQRFQGVRVHDSTTITLPDSLAEHWRGCGGSDPSRLPPRSLVAYSSICLPVRCAASTWPMDAPPTNAWASSIKPCRRAVCAWPTWAFMT